MRAAVVGHVEWVRFAKVERLPEQGAIVTAADSWEEPGGGGADAAGELIRLGAEVDFFVAVGNDELGARAREALETLGCPGSTPGSPSNRRSDSIGFWFSPGRKSRGKGFACGWLTMADFLDAAFHPMTM